MALRGQPNGAGCGRWWRYGQNFKGRRAGRPGGAGQGRAQLRCCLQPRAFYLPPLVGLSGGRAWAAALQPAAQACPPKGCHAVCGTRQWGRGQQGKVLGRFRLPGEACSVQSAAVAVQGAGLGDRDVSAQSTAKFVNPFFQIPASIARSASVSAGKLAYALLIHIHHPRLPLPALSWWPSPPLLQPCCTPCRMRMSR